MKLECGMVGNYRVIGEFACHQVWIRLDVLRPCSPWHGGIQASAHTQETAGLYISREKIVARADALPTCRVSSYKLGMGENRVSGEEICHTHDLLLCIVITTYYSDIYAD